MEAFADAFGAFIIILGSCAGLSLIIWTGTRAKIARIQAEYSMRMGRMPAGQQNDAILEEVKALKSQLGDMQNTSHQFDIAFDEALHRLETRVSRMEAQTPARRAESTPQAEPQRVVIPGGRADS